MNTSSRALRWLPRLFLGLLVLPFCAVLALATIETLGCMDGKRVRKLEAFIGPQVPCMIEVAEPGKKHTLEIRTRKRKLDVRIEAPGGETIYEASALRRKRSRCLSFVPTEPGEYSLFLERGRTLSLSMDSPSPETAKIEVYLDDGRFAQPFLTSLGL